MYPTHCSGPNIASSSNTWSYVRQTSETYSLSSSFLEEVPEKYQYPGLAVLVREVFLNFSGSNRCRELFFEDFFGKFLSGIIALRAGDARICGAGALLEL
jgi:hypothetical protein